MPLLAALISSVVSAAASAATPAACNDVLASATDRPSTVRRVEARDLIGLRDIGPFGSALNGGTPFGVSPDGRWVAFEMHRADPDVNRYCVALILISSTGTAPPRLLDSGGDLVAMTINLRGISAMPNGMPALITPSWSPDGSRIAFLRSDGGIAQIWIVRPDGGGAHAVTHEEVSVEAFQWAPDGHHLLFQDRRSLIEQQRSTEKEARTGFHFDGRFSPMTSSRPLPSDPAPVDRWSIDVQTGDTRRVNSEEATQLEDSKRSVDGTLAVASDGRRAWIGPDRNMPDGAPHIHIKGSVGPEQDCDALLCTNATGLWWSPDGRSIVFARREGWARETGALYIWSPTGSAPRRLLATRDLLIGCVQARGDLVCAHEAADQPREVVHLDPSTGRWKQLFDPNPNFASLSLAPAERLHWRNRYGIETFGDLVRPVGYRRGRRYPLIIVQYGSRGFLRGGTGDEYPIQLFAAHGFAVLSVQRPTALSSRFPGLSDAAAERIDMRGWQDRRSVLSSIDRGVELVARLGIADPVRVGITGLSDGGSTVQFALANHRPYAAAIASSCCIEPESVAALLSEGNSDFFRSIGYPTLNRYAAGFWRPISLERNAASIRTPLLLQLPEHEYLLGLGSVSALRASGKTAELFVYPDEYHIKSQPTHRLAIYMRNLAWFTKWLKPSNADL